MLRKNSRTQVLILMLAAAALIAVAVQTSLANGWGRGCGMMGYGPSWGDSNVPEKYWLTPEQRKQINEIESKYDEKIFPLQQELRALRIETRGYQSRPDSDFGKIKSYRKDIRELESKIEDLRLEAREETRAVLTEEQRAFFGDNYGWWDGGMGMRHGMMGNMDMYDMCPMRSGY